jgi:hypothetical protein
MFQVGSHVDCTVASWLNPFITGLAVTLGAEVVLLTLLGITTFHYNRLNRLVRSGKRKEPLEGQPGFYYTLWNALRAYMLSQVLWLVIHAIPNDFLQFYQLCRYRIQMNIFAFHSAHVGWNFFERFQTFCLMSFNAIPRILLRRRVPAVKPLPDTHVFGN